MLKVAHAFKLTQNEYSAFSFYREKWNMKKKLKQHYSNTKLQQIYAFKI